MSGYACNYIDGATPDNSVASTGAAMAQPDDAETGPRARTRGNFRGFLPSGTAADLQTLADSGAGAQRMGHHCGCQGGGGKGLLLLAGVGFLVFLAVRHNR